jgi:hypothetical protein
MGNEPCKITGPDPDIGLKHCRTCGLEWHKSERKQNCPYIETASQKAERLESENEKMLKALKLIDALSPPKRVLSGMQQGAVNGLVLRIGEIARNAIGEE